MSGVSVKMGSLQQVDYFPHIEILLHAMRINRERLNGRSKIAVDAKLLRRLVELAVSQLPFSSEFYERTYHDIAEARAAGKIADLHKHFIETGFFEGRLGAEPSMDEAYYRGAYRDVALAVQRGDATTLYDTADHQIGGVSQQQQNNDGGATFTSQNGDVRLEDLKVVSR